MKSKIINISLPQSLYEAAKKRQKADHYTFSEMIRDALRWWMNPRLTRNGFTPEFEREVLEAEKEADAGNVVEWDGKGSFDKFVLTHPVPNAHAKNKVRRKVSTKSSEIKTHLSRTREDHQQAYPVV